MARLHAPASFFPDIEPGPIRGYDGEFRVEKLTLEERRDHALAQLARQFEQKRAEITRFYERRLAAQK